MKLNTKTRYGLRTMLELALNYNNQNGLYQKEISEKQQISLKYLDQIIASLKASGLIGNVGGKKSGYTLTRGPENITIYDIYKAFEYEMAVIDCYNDKKKCSRNRWCATKEFWVGLNELIIKYMDSVKLSELTEKQRELLVMKEENNMYYI